MLTTGEVPSGREAAASGPAGCEAPSGPGGCEAPSRPGACEASPGPAVSPAGPEELELHPAIAPAQRIDRRTRIRSDGVFIVCALSGAPRSTLVAPCGNHPLRTRGLRDTALASRYQGG